MIPSGHELPHASVAPFTFNSAQTPPTEDHPEWILCDRPYSSPASQPADAFKSIDIGLAMDIHIHGEDEGTTALLFSEIKTLDSECCAPCKKLRRLEARLEEAKRLVTQLTAEKVTIKSEINSTHDPITAKLPVEVISRIFSLATADWDVLPATLEQGSACVRAPLFFGTVCRRWREIAWSTPSLWTDVDICMSPRKAVYEASVLEEWLGRSGQLPLTIHLRCSDMCSEQESITFSNEALDVINQHSARWKDLTLQLHFQSLSRLRGDGDSGALLTDISVYPQPEEFERPRFPTVVHLPNATPRTVGSANLSFKAIKINWSKVTTVYLAEFFVDECLQLFQSAPQLMNCNIECIVAGNDNNPIPRHPLVLSSLKCLSISDLDLTPSVLLGKIRTPFLEDITYAVQDLIDLKSLITRSACPLRRLSLSYIDAQITDIIDLLRATTQLEVLELTGCQVTSEFIDLLSATSSTPKDEVAQGFLPYLERLSIHVSYPEFSWDGFATLLIPSPSEPEANRRRPLSSVFFHMQASEIDPPWYIKEETISQLLEVAERGFELHIRYGNAYDDFVERSRKFHEDCRRQVEGVANVAQADVEGAL